MNWRRIEEKLIRNDDDDNNNNSNSNLSELITSEPTYLGT